MEKQTRMITIKINEKLKTDFESRASEKQMKISTRIKYLMKLDVDNKLIIKNG